MSLIPRPSTPARLLSPGAAKLPRWVLLAVGLLYIFAGLLFRDPWKSDDVIGLATMLTALNQGSPISLWLPQVGSLAYAENGPLVTWVGLSFIKLFSPIFSWFTSDINAVILASRLPNLLWFGLLTYFFWYGTYHLARSPEAQPLPLPFGGEPPASAYGRMVADAALLLLLATVGILWRMHESSSVPAMIAFQAWAYYCLGRVVERPLAACLGLGLALGCALLTRGFVGGIPIFLGSVAVFIWHPLLRRQLQWLLLSVLIAALLFVAWWWPARDLSLFWTQTWLEWNTQSFAWPHWATGIKSLRDLSWFLWPTWPLALIGLWNWRRWHQALHIVLPTSLLASAFVCLFFYQDPFEPEFALLAVPSAALAAFALPTLRRGVINTLDWFAVMCFSLTAAAVWLGWVAQQTGWPPKIAQSIARQTEGFDNSISALAVLVALVGSCAWVSLVIWRTRRHPPALWRGTVLSAGGLLATWLLLVTLWLPTLDYARSYRGVSAELAQALAQHQRTNECVRGSQVALGQRASFYVFDEIDLQFDQRCTLVVEQLDRKLYLQGLLPISDTDQELWLGRRGGDRHEMFRLVRRPAKP
ncbi:MAG TPA: glycosyltransferase [Candidatus Paenalcaligenes intestinipullorum]|uniref:Glycosyltransferase n=1 Tax=Candidatus Paenalcaligenes intestinipullorum TaxID=2838718 RepID=A0A9D2RI71_9BURK|nr:glycosyltransferase [Candidatus Paenalcaligenes intestinipullorum]